MKRWILLGLSLVGGGVQAWAIASPLSGDTSWWLQLAAMTTLYLLSERCRSATASASVTWLFACAWITGSIWWLFISMNVYGGLPAIVASLAVLGLSGFLASFYALAGAILHVLRPSAALMRAGSFGALWLAAELTRATVLTGFPWGAIGYAHVDGPLASLAPWVGVYGISAVSAFAAASIGAILLRQIPWRHAWQLMAFFAFLVAAANGLPQARPPATVPGPISVALLQANIPQDRKFDAATGVREALQWYAEQLMTADASLIVTPETALPLLPDELPAGYIDTLRQRFAAGRQAALIGLPLGNGQRGYSNSVLGLRPGQAPYRYDKHHPVPFGEFVPRLFAWFVRMMNMPLGEFEPGAAVQTSFEWMGNRFALNICFEDVFGEELAARFRDDATAPTVFVNVSNIAWFGNTVSIDQHLHISRMRAREFERPMVRATNTGATAVIDHSGRVTHLLPGYTRGVLVAHVQGNGRITPYAWWASRFGLWPLWTLVIVILALATVAPLLHRACRTSGPEAG